MNINEVILTIMVAGFGFNFALMYIIWSSLTTKIEKIETKLDNMNERLIIVETMLHLKDCCLLKTDQSLKKAE
jgi:hypothetical protein